MAKYSIEDSTLVAIGDAIREKNGTTETMTPAEMAEAISAIEAGGNSEAEDLLVQVIEKTTTEVHNDKATRIGTMVFRNSPIRVADFPNVTELGSYAFTGASDLVTVNMPSLTSVVKNGFESCSSLTTLDFPKVTSIQASAFASCSKLTVLILRANRVVSLANVNALSTALKTGGGYTYVPATLVDDYKAATNWSSYPDKIRAIEDYPEICGG